MAENHPSGERLRLADDIYGKMRKRSLSRLIWPKEDTKMYVLLRAKISQFYSNGFWEFLASEVQLK